MTTRFVFIELPAIAAFIAGVKRLSNASKTIIPCFLRSAPGLLFHTTKYQFFTSSLLIQPLGWYLTMIPLSSCSVVNVLQFRITYGGNLIPSARPLTWLLHTCHNVFQLPQILPHCHLQFNCMAYKNTLAFHQHFLIGSWCNCYSSESNRTSLTSNKLLFEICWQFLAK